MSETGFLDDRLHIDWPPGQDAKTHDRHVLMVDMKLHAERSADIRGYDADARLGNAVVAAIDVLKLIGRLCSMMDSQLGFAKS